MKAHSSLFSNWLQNKWYEHRDEVERWGGTPFTDVRAYFIKYKWWLKALYRKEQAEAEARQQRKELYGNHA